jgi:hypothetical protein
MERFSVKERFGKMPLLLPTICNQKVGYFIKEFASTEKGDV